MTGTSGCSTSALPTVSPRPCTSWIDLGRQAGLEQDLDQQVDGVGHVLRRLDDHRVPAEQRGKHLPGGDGQREVERRDQARRRRWAGGSSSPTWSGAPTGPRGRRAAGPRWPRSRRCRCPPARRPGSRPAPCPSRASSRRRSPPSARPAGRPPGGARRPGPAPACATRARSRAWPSAPRPRRRAGRNRGSGRSGRRCRPGCGSRSRRRSPGATHSPPMKFLKVLAMSPDVLYDVGARLVARRRWLRPWAGGSGAVWAGRPVAPARLWRGRARSELSAA